MGAVCCLKYQDTFRGNRFPPSRGYKNADHDRPTKTSLTPRRNHRGKWVGASPQKHVPGRRSRARACARFLLSGRTEGPGDEQHICRFKFGNAPEYDLAAVHLAHFLLQEALSIGHDQSGVAMRLVDHILLGIVDLIGHIQQAQVIGRDASVGGNDLALSVLVRIADADRIVDLLVEPDAVVNDRLVIDEVITTDRLWFDTPLSTYLSRSSIPGELDKVRRSGVMST